MSDKKAKLILWLDEISSRDSAIVGSKAANLGELKKIGIPVSDGFCLTCRAYDIFRGRQRAYPSEAFRENAKGTSSDFDGACFPKQFVSELSSAYDDLTKTIVSKARLVVVRSSARIEDLAKASFAGQYETVIGVRGIARLMESVKSCYASLHSAKVAAYRRRLGLGEEDDAMGIIVQALIDARSSGVMFTTDPISQDDSRIIVEGSWGLAQSIVGGEVTPDRFVLTKTDLGVLETRLSKKDLEIVLSQGKVVRKRVPAARRKAYSITKNEAMSLARLGLKIEKHFKVPQDIEWTISRRHDLIVVQTRPVTSSNRRV